MKLKTITGKNSYCGPAAIAAITGVTTDEAARVIRETGYKRRSVRRIYPEELCWALEKMGFSASYDTHPDKPTLARWIREREDRRALTIVYVTGHYGVVVGNKYSDNRTKDPVWTSKAPGRRKRVNGVITVEGNGA